MATIKVIIDVECAPADEKKTRELFAKYTFLSDGIVSIDKYMTKTDFFVTPHIKKMVKPKK